MVKKQKKRSKTLTIICFLCFLILATIQRESIYGTVFSATGKSGAITSFIIALTATAVTMYLQSKASLENYRLYAVAYLSTATYAWVEYGMLYLSIYALQKAHGYYQHVFQSFRVYEAYTIFIWIAYILLLSTKLKVRKLQKNLRMKANLVKTAEPEEENKQ